MRLKNIVNISGIAVAVNSKNDTFGNNVNCCEMSAIQNSCNLLLNSCPCSTLVCITTFLILFYDSIKVM